MTEAAPERWLSRTASKAKRSFSVKKSLRRVVHRDEEATGPDASGVYDYLCSICTQLLTSPAHQKKLFSKDGFARGSKLFHQCRLCQQIMEVIQARGASTTADLSSCTIHAVNKNREYLYDYGAQAFGYIGLNPDEKSSGPAELTELAYLHVRLSSDEHIDISSKSLLMINPVFNDASEKMFAEPNPPVHDYELSDDFLVRRARAQIRDCRKNHIQCKATAGRLPKRVIDVNPTGDGSTVRVHITGRHEKTPYVALSYCWGGEQKVTTTAKTLAANLISIPKNTLDQTIQDAIVMTKKLGFHYLWVDSLCIIQDNYDDKAKEIQVMDDIFRNATLTIAAASAAHAHQGFLGPKCAAMLESKHKLPLRLPEGELGYITAIAEKTIKGKAKWPLETRAWALQEAILSRRMLIFADGDVRYQCQTLDLYPVVPNPVVYADRIERLPRRHHELKTFLQVKWYDILEDYTRRSLSNENDRLIAISGIVKRLQSRMANTVDMDTDEYFAGMWKSGIAGNLLWYTRSPLPINSSMTRSSIAQNSPSFSWASLGAPVNFLGVLTPSVTFLQWGEKSDDFIRLPGQGETFATLTVKAFILPLKRLLFDHLPKLCQVEAVTLTDLSMVLHIFEDYEGREGFEVSDNSVLLRVDDGANSRDHRGVICNCVEGAKYLRRVGVYSELDWESRAREVGKVDGVGLGEEKTVELTRLQKVLAKPEAWAGYTRAEVTLV